MQIILDVYILITKSTCINILKHKKIAALGGFPRAV